MEKLSIPHLINMDNQNFHIKVSSNYSVNPEDFQLGNDWVDPAFKNFENTRIDLSLPSGELVGYLIFTYLKTTNGEKNSPFVRFVWIYPEYRGNQYSIKLYQKANEFCLSAYGVNLCSDKISYIRKSALKNWDRMVEQGIATLKGDHFELS